MKAEVIDKLEIPKLQHEDIDISSIIIGERYRKDLGDIESLVDSIRSIGLLQPVGVTNGNELVFGERRLRAFQQLGWLRIPVRRVPVKRIVDGEYAENEIRKDFTPSERVAIAEAVLAEVDERRGGANVDKYPQLTGVKTREVAAEKAGFGSDFTYRQAKSVLATGTPELIEAMDKEEVSISAAAVIAQEDKEIQKRIVAEENMTRAAASLRKAKEELRKAESLPKARPLSDEEKEERKEVFGTQEDRAIDARISEVLEAIEKQPGPTEAVKRIPPTLAHAVDVERIRSAAAWLTDFCDAWEAKDIPAFLKEAA